jgi:hypothetical protein
MKTGQRLQVAAGNGGCHRIDGGKFSRDLIAVRLQ